MICGERIPYSDKNPFYPEGFDDEIINLPAYDYKFLHKNDGKEIIAENLILRNPCKVCNNTTAFVTKSNMQHVAYCDNCGAYAYGPSKADLGMKNETQTRMAKANQNKRMRILARDGARRVSCGKTGADDALHIAHIISDYDAQCLHKSYPAFKLDYIYDDDNLFTCCSECNLGQGKESLIPKLAVFVSMMIRKRDKKQ